jgi:flagellar motor switch/type III secretory pathway protein FliN
MVDGWSSVWFAGEGLRAVGALARIAEPRTELRKMQWHGCDAGVAIGVPVAGAAAIGALVLALAPRGADRPRADLDVLEQVGGECLDDLKARVGATLALPSGTVWRVADEPRHRGEGFRRIEIAGPSRSLVLALELGAERFARFVKAKLPLPPAMAPIPAPDAALAQLRVQVSAELGRCAITVAELAALAEGDVVILDRALDAALPLSIEGRRARTGACMVVERAGAPALEISQAPTG